MCLCVRENILMQPNASMLRCLEDPEWTCHSSDTLSIKEQGVLFSMKHLSEPKFSRGAMEHTEE